MIVSFFVTVKKERARWDETIRSQLGKGFANESKAQKNIEEKQRR